MLDLRQSPDVRAVLSKARTIAVLGAHPTQSRPAFYVPDYLFSQGYRILPVNPRFAGRGLALWGQPIRATLAELGEPVHIVDIFRASDSVPDHLQDILAMDPRPGLVWLQQGIRNDAVGQAVKAAGIGFIQDRCTLADHRAMGIGRVGEGP